MKLTPHDLIHGGLYRHKETGDVYRLSLDYPARLEPPDGFGIEYELDFFVNLEPIPLTAEILREWFETTETDNGILLHSQEDEELEELIEYGEFGFQVIGYSSKAHITIVMHVHNLQSLVYCLHGEELEGGPK